MLIMKNNLFNDKVELTLSLLSASFLREKINHFSLKMYQIWHMSFCMTILTGEFTKFSC